MQRGNKSRRAVHSLLRTSHVIVLVYDGDVLPAASQSHSLLYQSLHHPVPAAAAVLRSFCRCFSLIPSCYNLPLRSPVITLIYAPQATVAVAYWSGVGGAHGKIKRGS